MIHKFDPNEAWIGVDLDGTLAVDTGWRGIEHIGEPIQPMVDRIRRWLAAGYKVRIFTARAGVPECIPYIKAFLNKINLGHLPITDKKDYNMIQLWDDRSVAVYPNTGLPMHNVMAPFPEPKYHPECRFETTATG